MLEFDVEISEFEMHPVSAIFQNMSYFGIHPCKIESSKNFQIKSKELIEDIGEDCPEHLLEINEPNWGIVNMPNSILSSQLQTTLFFQPFPT